MKLALPFAKKPKVEIVSVGNEEVGILYLQKINGRTGIERKQLSKVEDLETRLQLLLFKLAKKVATDKNIDLDSALQLILTEDQESSELAAYTDEIEKMLKLKTEAQEYRDEVVAVMLRERIAYPVKVASAARAKEESISVEPLTFPLEVKSAIKFPNQTVYLGSQGNLEDEVLNLDEPLQIGLEKNAIGFLADDYGNYIIGCEDWDLEATASIPDSIAEEIFHFYQGELQGKSSEPGKKEVSRSKSKSSKTTSQETQLTGMNSTGEPNPTELLTIE